MDSSLAFFVFFSLVLVGNTIATRKDPGEYWKDAMEGQPMPKSMDGAVLSAQKRDCPTVASKEEANKLLKDFENKLEKAFVEDFEPRPNVSVYHDDEAASKEDKSFVNDFEPRPNVSVYHDDEAASKEDKSFVNDFEPRPNVSVYHDDEAASKEDKSFVK